MNTRSITFRLVLWYTGLLTGIFILLGILLYLGLQHFVVSDRKEMQMHRNRSIATTIITHLQPGDEKHVAGEIESLYQPEVYSRFIRISRADGTVVYRSGEPADGSFNPEDVPKLSPFEQDEFTRIISLPGNKTMILGGIYCVSQNTQHFYVESGMLLDPVEEMLRHLFMQLALCLPLAVAIIAVGGWLLVRRALQPVAEITRAAEQITQHNTSERMPVAHTGDELEKLSLSLNRMIARLDDALRNSTRFVADASHELRTPLTILYGELEMLAQDDDLPEETRDRILSLLEEVGELGKIVEQLFALSRLDAGEAQTEWKALDLAELARTTADQMSLLAEDKHILIGCDASQPVVIEGDRARIKQIVVNLLDNAIKYTPENGSIQLSVNALNGQAVLEVSDNGIGIPAEALPHVCERFFRVDQSRSAESVGAGLGLSIVKSICTAHGAQVDVQSIVRQGSCFRVRFPLGSN